MNNELIFESILNFVNYYNNFQNNIDSQKVFPDMNNDKISKLKEIPFASESRDINEVMQEMQNLVYNNQAYMQHPRCFAFIPSPVSLLSWAGEIMTSAFNPHGGSWLQSPSASCIESKIIEWMCKLAGYPDTSGGLFVSGGSMANLTALTTARNVKLGEDEYPKGIAYVSDQTHSSVAKGLKIIGFREDQIRKVPTNENYQLDVDSLETIICEDKAKGFIPFAVIATSGTTNTGSVDPLHSIADICDKYGLWFHVDGAYGATVLVSDKYRHLLDGISRSDSISWDAHKWLLQTYSCSTILIREKKHLMSTFSTHPEYLKDAQTNNEQINYWDFGPELTRPARSLKLWLTLQTLGVDNISDGIEHSIELVEFMENELKKYDNWEIVSSAHLAILNFRYVPVGANKQQVDEFNKAISKTILDSGYAGILTTSLHGKTVLRVCSINPETTKEDIQNTINLLVEIVNNLQNK